jgi:hypothetical protein
MEHFELCLKSRGSLRPAFRLLEAPCCMVSGYCAESGALTLYCGPSPYANALLLPISVDEAADLARRWLRQADYGPAPDYGIASKKGWYLRGYRPLDYSRLNTSSTVTPNVCNEPAVLAVIRPIWCCLIFVSGDAMDVLDLLMWATGHSRF